MVRAKDNVWFFDEKAFGHEAVIESVLENGDYPKVNLLYIDKNGNRQYKNNVPHKDEADIVEFHPFRVYPENHPKAGQPMEWNVKINCYKPRG